MDVPSPIVDFPFDFDKTLFDDCGLNMSCGSLPHVDALLWDDEPMIAVSAPEMGQVAHSTISDSTLPRYLCSTPVPVPTPLDSWDFCAPEMDNLQVPLPQTMGWPIVPSDVQRSSLQVPALLPVAPLAQRISILVQSRNAGAADTFAAAFASCGPCAAKVVYDATAALTDSDIATVDTIVLLVLDAEGLADLATALLHPAKLPSLEVLTVPELSGHPHMAHHALSAVKCVSDAADIQAEATSLYERSTWACMPSPATAVPCTFMFPDVSTDAPDVVDEAFEAQMAILLAQSVSMIDKTVCSSHYPSCGTMLPTIQFSHSAVSL